MTDSPTHEDGDDRTDLAAAFGRDLDPLAAYTDTFDTLDVDPFELFWTEGIDDDAIADSTRRGYQRIIHQWRDHMAAAERHPACPNDQHVRSFSQYCQHARGNQPDTVRTKLRRLNKVYEYWQADPAFPHPTDYNPFTLALSRLDLERPPTKEPPRIPIEDLAAVLRGVTHLRDRTLLVVQLKLGLRATELCNLQLSDLHITASSVQGGYPQLGTHDARTDRQNAVYIPSRYERDGNKSHRPRVLPIDEELQSLLHHHLLTRPDTGTPWVFQSKLTHGQLQQESVNRIWTDTFHPEYAETDEHRAVTSHFGRHRFTTYWQVAQDVDRELVQYMRGDRTDSDHPEREAIDDYVHTYYEDIESVYREQMFTLGV